MVEISSEDEFKAWLGGKPREVSVCLAIRATMRALPAWPILGLEGDPFTWSRRADILPVFRALSAALCAVYTGRHEAKSIYLFNLASAIASQTSDIVSWFRSSGNPYPDATPNSLLHAANTLSSAENRIVSDEVAAATMDSLNATTNSERLYGKYKPGKPKNPVRFKVWDEDLKIFWGSVSHDCSFSIGSAWQTRVLSEPIWPKGIPKSTNDALCQFSSGLRAHKSEGWEVWTDWYQARLDGAPYDLELE